MKLLRKFWYWAKVSCTYVQPPEFGIKRGYLHRRKVLSYNDNSMTDEYQKEVYEYAKELYIQQELQGVLDIGCGSAYKLMKFFKDESKVGVELDVSYLEEKYPLEMWFPFSNPEWKKVSAELLICADVIEHVPNPDVFLRELASLPHTKVWIFSTPDRNLENSPWTHGPPKNEFHFREWTFEELQMYLSNYFDVSAHQITNREQRTQMVVCKRKIR